MNEPMQAFEHQFKVLQTTTADLYDFLNQLRDWLNKTMVNYEIFLEDNWFEDKTTIEYTLRSLDTFDTLVFAEDAYGNARDEKGVWHLGAYTHSYWIIENCWPHFERFIAQNGLPRYRAV